ncbi:MAG: hypothetical protein SangKO_038470 [Sandaracinaceae bacterium]
MTNPGGFDAPTVIDPPAEVPIDVEALDSSDFERVTLVDLPTIVRYDKYELLGRLAYGGMAEIFLAREVGQQNTRRMMVVKRVLPHVAEDPHFVDMFVDEARLAMQLSHPNICHVYSFGEAEGTYYIAMEWVNGMPLSKIIRRAKDGEGLPIPLVLKVIAQVAEALDYAHRASDASGEPLGVVHRDVSPQNVMVSYDGVVKLLDFGIAKAASHSTRTEAGVIKGKFAYMSPQQCVGEPIDARADIFALGICLFEALTGKNPFRRKTEFDTMTRIVGDPTPDARERRADIPDAIQDVLDKALMKQPERRFQTAGEMQMAIEAVIPTLGMPVNSTRIGEYVSHLFSDVVRDGPSLDTRIQEAPPPLSGTGQSGESGRSVPRRPRPPGSTELDAEAMPPAAASMPPPKSSFGAIAGVMVLFALVALAGLGATGAWLLLGRGEPQAVAVQTPPAPAPTPPAAPDPTPLVAPTGPMPGSVFLESDPSGASVRFGDRGEVGTTPLEIGMIQPGTYDVRVELDGHEPYDGRVTVVAGRRASLTAELERVRRQIARRPHGPPGRLSLNTRPWSKVYVGRRLLGTTPIGRVEVPSGTVRLRLVDRDGAEHRRAVRVPPGEHVTESFDLRE